MTMSTTTGDGDFPLFYGRRTQTLDHPYEASEFLYPHDAPWPEASFDYPYGQAPQVMNIPAQEMDDWSATIGKYYKENAVGSVTHPTPFGVASLKFARANFFDNGMSGYAPLDDDDFVELICEGLYSKFLSPLDPQDEALFDLPSVLADHADGYEYFKSDYRCMSVVQKTWPGEHALPSVAVVRRRRDLPKDRKYAHQGAYELVAVAIGRQREPGGAYEFTRDLVFNCRDHQQHAGWWLAKYFVLQGAIHRINLIDHVKVHFPPDTINAVTKSVLPRWHLLQQLLLPHFRLTLPVNNAVLEGDRSLINRDTWYPWSPFVAKGYEIRKLFPFAWAGAHYYGDEKNSSYPAFRYSLDPASSPDPDDPARSLPNFIGMDCSRYGAFLLSYYEPVLEFTRAVIGTLPDAPANPRDHGDLQWLEIQRWAYEISRMLPGFPDENAICSKETLARVCAMIIWNAAVVHSSDHTTLHKMMNEKPVPFVIRVMPPLDRDDPGKADLAAALGTDGREHLADLFHGFIDKVEQQGLTTALVGHAVEGLADLIGGLKARGGTIPLCHPTDLMYARMADLLFYRPHNTTLLYDCPYAFEQDPDPQDEKAWQEWRRPFPGSGQREILRGARAAFQRALDTVNQRYYHPDGTPVEPPPANSNEHADTDDAMLRLNFFAFPKLRPGTAEEQSEDVRQMLRREACLGAGVQY
jgi:hypothetical protein